MDEMDRGRVSVRQRTRCYSDYVVDAVGRLDFERDFVSCEIETRWRVVSCFRETDNMKEDETVSCEGIVDPDKSHRTFRKQRINLLHRWRQAQQNPSCSAH